MRRDTPRLHAWLLRCIAGLGLFVSMNASCADARIAVAANFAGVAKQLADEFGKRSGHRVVLSVGATGKLYAQVVNGAPFEVFLAADDETPARMEREGRAVAGTRLTYAIGRLVLWSRIPGFVDAEARVLSGNRFRKLALANPRLAPYGQAAQQVLARLGVADGVRDRLVMGENIAQTLQFVSSGNAELGFIALAQLPEVEQRTPGSRWIVPSDLHDPLRQDAVLLARGVGNPAARAFLEHLRSAAGRATIQAGGYELP